MTDIQSTLDEITKQTDRRTSVFEIEVQELRNHSVALHGRLLDDSQLDGLRRLLPGLTLDTTSVRILSRERHARFHVATNLTGLYERPTFGMPLSSELTYGTELEILDEQGNWVFTRQQDGYLGWAYKPYLEADAAAPSTHLILAPCHELHAEPDERSPILTRLMSGTPVTLQATRAEWAQIAANKTGWIPLKYLRAFSDLPTTVQEKRESLIEDSACMIGIPYLWGGTTGNGIDCSGFTRLLHRWVGVSIPRDADQQCSAAAPVEPPFEVGDLLFFAEDDSNRKITHVGMSLGGWKMIHSSRSNNGVYVNNVQERKSLMDIYVSAGSFLRET